MKRKFSVIFIFLAFVFSIGCFSGFYKSKAFAKEIDKSDCYKSAYLADAYSGTKVFSKDEEKRLPIASMCKIMTLLLCFEAIENNELDFNEEIVISKNSAGMGGSQIFLEENASYKVEELIKGIVVASANDACVALAERLCGTEENFVDKMNEKASDLQMNNTCFVNCTGLPKINQYSCAKDVYTMFSALIKHKDYFRFSTIWMDKISHPKDRVTEITNTNKLIRFYDGCDSGKTGYTSETGHCLCASAIRGDVRFICVVICAKDSKTRFREVSNMFNYGFANYTNKLIVDNTNPLEVDVSVIGGKKQSLSVVAERPVYLFSNKNEKRSVEFDFKPENKIYAPIKKGDIVGKLSIYEFNKEIDCVNVIANEDIDKKCYIDNLIDVIDNWGLIN